MYLFLLIQLWFTMFCRENSLSDGKNKYDIKFFYGRVWSYGRSDASVQINQNLKYGKYW